MTNISFDEAASPAFPAPVTSYMYLDMNAPVPTVAREAKLDHNRTGQGIEQPAAPGMSAQDVDALLNHGARQQPSLGLRGQAQANDDACGTLGGNARREAVEGGRRHRLRESDAAQT